MLALTVPAAAAPRAGTAAPAGCTAEPKPGRIVRVTPEGEIALQGGETVRLLDVRLPTPDGLEAVVRDAAAAWLGSLAGLPVAVREAGPPDRWGRVPAAIEIEDGPDGIGRADVAEFLVGEGLARVDPGERDALCRPGLLDVETEARARQVGLWADEPAPFPATDVERLRGAAGRFVVVEGRILSVGERPARTYLNFGRDFARDFAVVVPRRTWQQMIRSGLTAAALTGRTVRIRGTVELRRGPTMEIATADVIEQRPDRPVRPATLTAGEREPR